MSTLRGLLRNLPIATSNKIVNKIDRVTAQSILYYRAKRRLTPGKIDCLRRRQNMAYIAKYLKEVMNAREFVVDRIKVIIFLIVHVPTNIMCII